MPSDRVGRLFRAVVTSFAIGAATSAEEVGAAGEGIGGAEGGIRFGASGAIDIGAISWASDFAARLVSGIEDTTKKGINDLVQRAIKNGWTEERFQEELQKSYLFSRDRALMIARTEAANATNAGAGTRWRDEGVEYVQVIDGETCDRACKEANGAIWRVQDFIDNPTAHPNCIRRAVPIRTSKVDVSKVTRPIDAEVFPNLRR